MKCIKQFRYYKKDSEDNYPNNMTYNNLVFGNIFRGYGSITQMGIQARPKTKFYLNGANLYPIVVGETGIYEIDLQGYGQITSIQFDAGSLEDYEEDGSNATLLIDIIYEGSGASV